MKAMVLNSPLALGIHMARFGSRNAFWNHYRQRRHAVFYDLYFKELALINGRVAKSEDYPAGIDMVQRGMVRLEPLISNRLAATDLVPNEVGSP